MILRTNIQIVALVSLLVACNESGFINSPTVKKSSFEVVSSTPSEEEQQKEQSTVNPQQKASTVVVCSGLGGEDASSEELSSSHGLRAHLYYDGVNSGHSRLEDYIQPELKVNYLDQVDGQRKDVEIIFDNLHVPTRNFSEGFPIVNAAGETLGHLKGPEGELLMEWFALDIQTNLNMEQLTPGTYQFATLSDDGVRVTLDGAEILSSNFNTSTRMTCSPGIEITQEHINQGTLPLKVEYFQGPATRIALVLMMRKVTDSADESLCGTAGNSSFFTTNSQGETVGNNNYLQLELNGWSVMGPEYFLLPSGSVNTCSVN